MVPKNEAKKWPPPGRFYCSVTLLVGPENGHTFRAQETHNKQKMFSAEATRVTFMFDQVVLPSVSLSWHLHGDTGSTTWEDPSSFSYLLLLGHVCEVDIGSHGHHTIFENGNELREFNY